MEGFPAQGWIKTKRNSQKPRSGGVWGREAADRPPAAPSPGGSPAADYTPTSLQPEDGAGRLLKRANRSWVWRKGSD